MATVDISQGSRSQLLIKNSGVIGSAPVGNFELLRYNSHSLNLVKDIVEPAEIRSDREVQDQRHGNRRSLGDIVCDLTYDSSQDRLINNLMFGNETTDGWTIGTSPQYSWIEDGALDISEYKRTINALVSRGSFSFRTGTEAVVKATFSLVGTDEEAPSGSSSGGTPIAAGGGQPFDSFTGSVYDQEPISGTELATITSIDINIDNGVDPVFAIGQQEAIALDYGRGRVTGQFTAVYKDATFLTRFRNETETALVVSVTDPDGDTMTFTMGRIKYNGASVPVVSERHRVITIPFQALLDTSLGTALAITKT